MRDGSNFQFTDDAARLVLARPKGPEISLFAGAPVEPSFGAFDDRRDPDESFWGSYVRGVPLGPRKDDGSGPLIDLYYVGQHRREISFNQGRGTDRRYTIGLRAHSQDSPLALDIEAAYQFGDFSDATIDAGFVAAQATYAARPNLRLGRDLSWASGDDDPEDQRLGSYSPIYPNAAYFKESALLQATNVASVEPFVDFSLNDSHSVKLGLAAFWRASEEDALYAPPGIVRFSPDLSSRRFIGTDTLIEWRWRIRPQVTLQAAYSFARAGSFVREAGGEDVHFSFVSLSWNY